MDTWVIAEKHGRESGSGRVEDRLPRRPVIDRCGAPVKSIGRPPVELAKVMERDCTTLWAIERQ